MSTFELGGGKAMRQLRRRMSEFGLWEGKGLCDSSGGGCLRSNCRRGAMHQLRQGMSAFEGGGRSINSTSTRIVHAPLAFSAGGSAGGLEGAVQGRGP
eukprot:354254-Chlamydomonas_euryale.AAC.6